jgi:hypothetical protein
MSRADKLFAFYMILATALITITTLYLFAEMNIVKTVPVVLMYAVLIVFYKITKDDRDDSI